MLERVAVRTLESGAQCLLRGGRLRKPQYLQSTLGIPSTVYPTSDPASESAPSPPADSTTSASTVPDHDAPPAEDPTLLLPTQPTSSSDLRSDSIPFEFLYPAKTLNFLKDFSGPSPRRRNSHSWFPARIFGLQRRPYATVASTSVKKEWIEKPPYTGPILTFDNLRDSQKEGEYDLAWELYQKESKGFYPHPSKTDFLCRYLLESGRDTDILRLLDVCRHVPIKSRTRTMDETMVICLLRSDEVRAAWKYIEDIVQRTKEPAHRGIEAYIGHHIQKRNWNEIIKTYALLRSYHGTPFDAEIRFPKVYSDMRFSITPSRAAKMVESNPWTILEWVRQLPIPSPTDPYALFIEEIAEDLIKGCLFNFTKWGSPWTPGSEQFWQICHERNWEVSSANWERMLAYLAYNQREDWFVQLYAIYREIQQPQEATLKILNDVMDILGHRGNLKAMKIVMDDIFELGQYGEPNRITYQIAMKHFGRMGATEAVHKVWNLYTSRYKVNRAKDFAHILQAHSKRGEIDMVAHWFTQISEKYGLKPEVLCYNILITAYGKANDMDAALYWIEQMLENGIEPDIYSYTALMESAAAKGDIATVEKLLDIIRRLAPSPNARWYRILASAYVNGGDLDRAHGVLRTVVEDCPGQEPTAIYNVVIAGYINAKRFLQADALFLEMGQRGVPFNNVSYSVLMYSLSLNGKPEVAEETLNYMKSVGLPVTANEYSTVIAGYMNNRNIEQAMEMYKQMEFDDIPPNFSCLALLIRIVSDMEFGRKKPKMFIGAYEEADAILQNVMANYANRVEFDSGDPVKSVIPPYVFTPLMKMYNRVNAHKKSMALFDKFVDISIAKRPTGSEPNFKMFELMMAVYDKTDQREAVKETWKALRKRARRHFEHLNDQGVYEVLPQYADKLHVPLRFYMRVCIADRDYDAIQHTVEQLLELRYSIHNVNWNDWVQGLAEGGPQRLLEALKICELHLMHRWELMRLYYLSASRQERRAQHGPSKSQLPDRRPFVRTLETLAAQLKDLSDRRWQNDAVATETWKEAVTIAPKTLEAIEGLHNLNERIQKDTMHRMQRHAFRGIGQINYYPTEEEIRREGRRLVKAGDEEMAQQEAINLAIRARKERVANDVEGGDEEAFDQRAELANQVGPEDEAEPADDLPTHVGDKEARDPIQSRKEDLDRIYKLKELMREREEKKKMEKLEKTAARQRRAWAKKDAIRAAKKALKDAEAAGETLSQKSEILEQLQKLERANSKSMPFSPLLDQVVEGMPDDSPFQTTKTEVKPPKDPDVDAPDDYLEASKRQEMELLKEVAGSKTSDEPVKEP